jgi:hypothetical protein
MIPSNLPEKNLPSFEINQETYETLGGNLSEKNTQELCNTPVFIKYSPRSHSLHSLEIL